MPRYKKSIRLKVPKSFKHGSKRPRPALVYSTMSPSPFRKRVKTSSLSKITPSKLSRTPTNQFLSPMICSPTRITGSKNKSITKRKLTFDKRSPNTNTNNDVEDTCELLIYLVQNNKFSTECISYKLFQDALRWHSIQNTSAMRYSEDVKEFFWTGRRLLGGQFLRFMRGYAHTGKVAQGVSTRGNYSPEDSDINLPVPSDRLLDDFRPPGIAITSGLQPGIIHENIDLYSKYDEVSYALMFDGKKIVPGTAEVFLLNQEDEPKYSERSAFFDTKIEKLSASIVLLETISSKSESVEVRHIDTNIRGSLTSNLKDVLKDLSLVVKSIRETYAKKKCYLQTIEKKFAEKGETKFKFAIDKIRTFLYKLRICLKDLLLVIDSLLLCCSILNGTSSSFSSTKQCNLDTQHNYRELREPSEVKQILGDDIPSYLTKQRTPEWFELRKTVKVTGSTLHKAIGLETLAAQKQHFDTVIGGKEPACATATQTEAMLHGSENEENAIATIASKVLPVYYPEYFFFEEGAFVVQDVDGRNVIVVSPDGSLRDSENNRKVSVEIKCPCPFYVGSTPVYYDVKKRHIMQCYAEAQVMECEEHLYVSWSKESMTVFKLHPNKELTQKAFKEALCNYYQEAPRRPSTLSDGAKHVKESLATEINNAEFICEVPSVFGVHASTRGREFTSCYYEPVQSNSTETEMLIEDIIQTLLKAKQLTQDAHSYQKPLATEVLIHLLSDLNRTWNLEIGHGLPVSFLYKGYSLTMATCRRVLEEILAACFQKGVHVACVAFDGQFAHIKDFDELNRPLTLFAFQRQYWASVKCMSKRELINVVNESFNEVTVTRQKKASIEEYENSTTEAGPFFVTNAKMNRNPIKSHPELIHKVVTMDVEANSDQLDTNGLDEEVANIVEKAVLSTLQIPENEESNISHDSESTDQLPSDQSTSSETNNVANEHDTTTENECKLTLEENDFRNMYSLLCSSEKCGKWQPGVKSVNDLKMAFETASAMEKLLIGTELQEVVKYVNVKLTKHNVMIKQSIRKGEKINLLFQYLGKSSKVEVKSVTRKVQTVHSLKTLCTNELNKRSYQKQALAVSYAESSWPREESKWYASPQVCVSKNVIIIDFEGTNQYELKPVYSPEYNSKRNEMQVRVMDGTHIRTNIKAKIIRSGIQNIESTGWKEVAKSGETLLTPSLLEVSQEGKLIHQQSDPHVRTMFCEDVERHLRTRGYNSEANFSRVFREWHEAEDKPGLSAKTRVERSLNLRQWLLQDYRFDRFPPKTQYVKGIPRVTFEGLISSIDAHILLYSICKGMCYNWRSVSTLVAENFMGELAERSQNNHGVPSGNSLAADMTKISELHAMRQNPNRAFHMSTAKSRAYTIPDLTNKEDTTYMQSTYNQQHEEHIEVSCSSTVHRSHDESTETLTEDENDVDPGRVRPGIEQATVTGPKISRVVLRNHDFDIREGGKVKMGTVRKFGEKPRGVQSVRTHYKVQEDKLYPSLSLGLSEELLADI